MTMNLLQQESTGARRPFVNGERTQRYKTILGLTALLGAIFGAWHREAAQ